MATGSLSPAQCMHRTLSIVNGKPDAQAPCIIAELSEAVTGLVQTQLIATGTLYLMHNNNSLMQLMPTPCSG
jgi:hypothetical protein